MKKLFWLTVVVVLAVLSAFAFYYNSHKTHARADFLTMHWERPLLPQGNPPRGFSELEASLSPAACGACHQDQYQDWQQSLHSSTMQESILWQMQLLSPQESNKCMDCHAPLAEQKALIAIENDWPSAPKGDLPNHVAPDLAHEGLVCAACHVRQHTRFGPPPSDNALQGKAHRGYKVAKEFEDSRFCSSCHQFEEDGGRTAGKLREDTYEQWKQTEFAAQGVQCQGCHMPNRQHRWEGIHSSKMLEQGITTSLIKQGDKLVASLANTGAGHHLPTYMVAKIDMQLVLMSEGAEHLLAETRIGWQVDIQLEKEAFDTRLKAGEKVELTAVMPADVTGGEVQLRLFVLPEEQYERSFAHSLTFTQQLDESTLAMVQKAYDKAVASRYQLVAESLQF